MPQIRMKSGIRLTGSGRWELVVHMWDDGDTSKEPVKYTSDDTFDSEEAAMKHYKEVTRPMLYGMIGKISKEVGSVVEINPLD